MQNAANHQTAERPDAGLNILLVEDNECDAELMRYFFAQTWMQGVVNVVCSGEDALDFIFRRGKYRDAVMPDIVFVDINLPGKSGIEIADILGAHAETIDIPVFLLSGAPPPVPSPDARTDKCPAIHACLSKPLTRASLANVLRAVDARHGDVKAAS
ncbi:MAG: response regulator [Alphaproteobacteria bacterium]|nr:response regulator [Alphaproteobacteria bacterium]